MEVECNEELYMSFWRYFAKTCETMHKTCEMRYILSRSNRKFKTSAIICFKGKNFFFEVICKVLTWMISLGDTFLSHFWKDKIIVNVNLKGNTLLPCNLDKVIFVVFSA